jgi:hypothetical protein
VNSYVVAVRSVINSLITVNEVRQMALIQVIFRNRCFDFGFRLRVGFVAYGSWFGFVSSRHFLVLAPTPSYDIGLLTRFCH